MQNKKLRSYVDLYIEVFCLLEDGQTPATTVYKKRHTLNRFLKFHKGKLTIVAINKYRSHLLKNDWQNRSVRHELQVIKAFVNWLTRTHEGVLNFKGADIHLPRIKRINYDLLSMEIAEKVIIAGTTPGKYDKSAIHKKSKADSRIAMILALYTGIRAIEILRLKGEDLDIENKTFKIRSKGGNEDLAPLPDVKNLISELAKRRHREKVFVCSSKAMNGHLKRGLKALKIDKRITLHSLRRIFATDLANQGAPTHDIAQAMRHKNIKITWDTYIRLNPEHQRRAMRKYHSLIRKNRPVKEKAEDLINFARDFGDVVESKIDGNEIVLRVKIK